jgi:gas vesicle protein
MSDDRNSMLEAMGILGTMLVGAVIGAGVALLLAPKSGAELREDLKASAEKISGEVSDATHKAGESVRVQVDRLSEKAAELGKKAEELSTRLTKPAEDPEEA